MRPGRAIRPHEHVCSTVWAGPTGPTSMYALKACVAAGTRDGFSRQNDPALGSARKKEPENRHSRRGEPTTPACWPASPLRCVVSAAQAPWACALLWTHARWDVLMRTDGTGSERGLQRQR